MARDSFRHLAAPAHAVKSYSKPALERPAKTLKAHYYTSAEIFDREREKIFAREWIAVGREEQIREPGAFFVCEPARESIIVVRGRDGAIRAFYNVCRHRGTRLCERAGGTFSGSIQCPYHAWTYALDGALMAARNMDGVPGFTAVEFPLKQARCAAFEGIVFVALDETAPSLDEAFAPLTGRFSQWNIPALHRARSIEYDLQCNWKLVFLNYSECYDCPVLHPQLERLSPWDSGRNDFSSGPFLGGYSELRDDAASLTTSGERVREPIASVQPQNHRRVYYYTVFPSMLLSLHPDYVMIHYVQPLSAQRTRVVCEWLFAADSPGNTSDAIEFWDLTNRQDWHVNELTQAGLRSRAYEAGPYSHAEALLAAFDEHYLRVMARV